MLTTPFLTDLDPRRAVKGSRDPLGMQAIWVHFGRQVVGNLTTVSTSVRDFTITSLGYHLIERAVEQGCRDTDLPIFIRWEQLAGYARAAINGEEGFRGTDRVHRNLEAGGPVTLSAERTHQILGSQKIYGIWGLYTGPSSRSGMLGGDPLRPQPATREHADQFWWPALAKAGFAEGRRLVEVLRPQRFRLDPAGRDRPLLAAVGALIRYPIRKGERAYYRHHLLEGGPDDSTRGLQRQLVDLIEGRQLDPDTPLSPTLVVALEKEARARHGKDSELAGHLARIRTCESVLAPVGRLFAWILGQHGRELGELATTLRQQWGKEVPTVDPSATRELASAFAAATGSSEAASRWLQIAECLAAGDYRQLIDLLLTQNQWVMSSRDGSSPWVERREGKCHVRFRDERADLPDRDELRSLWRYPYFIDSLRQVAASLGEAA